MKVLLAVDGSAYSKKMLAYLGAHEELLSPTSNQYHIMYAQPKLPGRAAFFVSQEVLNGYYEEEALKVLTPVEKFFEQRAIKAHTTWEIGPVSDMIARAAHAGAFDLLVMGSHGHSALANLVLGSVTTSVLSQTKLPVLIVR